LRQSALLRWKQFPPQAGEIAHRQHDLRLEIIWRDQGWQELAGELMPGTIGGELQEWEQQEVEA
jgi:hypothetical protein